ncbi:gustatory receptor 68a [Monomorium pharaonis]|uniref:gustatory receptor 68a n=1 Tax=Monomorium pharaonis TaxID=307658 RepID=UPI00102E1745|nr:gustatory receptor 68a [Monomorium pharaonis]
MSSVKNLKQAFMPIIWLNCIFCVGVFEIPINRPRFFLSVFYVIVILTGYSIFFYKGIFISQKITQHEFLMLDIVLAINILVAILAIILFWRKSECTNTIIKRNNITDNTLEALGIKKEYEKIYRNVWFLVTIWTVCIIIIMITCMLWGYHEIGYWYAFCRAICICFPVTVNSIIDLTFVSFIRCVHGKFQKTNTLINNIVLCVNESKSKILKRDDMFITLVMADYKNYKSKIIHLIRTLRHVHLEITKTARQINCVYCLQLLLELAVHFTIVASSIYCLYGVLFGKLRLIVDDKKIVALILWACIYSTKIILVNWLCTCVSTEACKTGEIIQSFEGSVIDDDLREEILQFTQQIILQPLNFTAFDFFSIDNSLTGKFFATVTTYVVILIQMNVPA